MDLRDLSFYDQKIESFKKMDAESLDKVLKEVTSWYNDEKNINPKSKAMPKGLIRWKGNRLVLLGGVPHMIHIKNKKAVATPYLKYMDKLTAGSGIPKGIWKKLQTDSGDLLKEIAPELSGKYPEGFDLEFKKWFKKHVAGQNSEQQFWKNFGNLKIAEGISKDDWRYKRNILEKDKSHYWPKSKGGVPFTFLENWLVNQTRGADEFVSQKDLQKLGIPTDWDELIDAVYKQKYKNGTTALGVNLEHISNFDANALVRGDKPDVIIKRNARIGKLQDIVFDNELEYHKSPDLQAEYIDLLMKSRGSEYEKWPYLGTDLLEDVHKIKDSMKKISFESGGGPNAKTNFSFDLPNKKQIGKGLLGSGITASSLLSEGGWAAFNPETAFHAGKLMSGEGDKSNVIGAGIGITDDLIWGNALKKAFQFASARAGKHFVGKKLLGKAVPYAGWGLLGYGIYDVGDAFTEGLTGKGLTERIRENPTIDRYIQIIEEELDPRKTWTDRHPPTDNLIALNRDFDYETKSDDDDEIEPNYATV